MHSHVLSRPMLISMHAHYSLTLPLPHTRRCGDAMLAYAALLCCCCMLRCCIPQHAWMDVWTVSPTVLAPLRAAAHNHPLTVRPLPRPSICGLVLDPALRACLPAIQQHTPMPCARGGRRQTWFDSSTSHAPTAWVTAFPSRTAACVPTGRAVASRLQVAFVALRTTPPSPNLTLHCTLSTSMSPMPANRDENCLQRVASASLTRRV